ncbi:CAP domain-containing protein [Lachnospiraceae bacterium C1.1]|nr:CAP domain-containing protein [Lachnospiraceae bacterium C1.1]
MKKDIFTKLIKSLSILSVTTFVVLSSTMTAFASDANTVDSQLLSSINELRAENGLPSLTLDSTLVSIAETRSDEASVLWSHTRPSGGKGADMISHDKWRGENLSYVTYSSYNGSDSEQSSAASLMFKNLCNSPSHYDNMVFSSYTKIGIATAVTKTASGTKVTTAYMFSN